MWTYEQSTGRVRDPSGAVTAVGYSGKGLAMNRPAMQDMKNEGPIPRGEYHMLAPENTTTHGPYVLWLLPEIDNKMMGRGGFGIHGDKIGYEGQHLASDGCIILPRVVRETMWNSGDPRLKVVA